eukprot:357115-Chlamydomonas_euryale.AAC.1
MYGGGAAAAAATVARGRPSRQVAREGGKWERGRGGAGKGERGRKGDEGGSRASQAPWRCKPLSRDAQGLRH